MPVRNDWSLIEVAYVEGYTNEANQFVPDPTYADISRHFHADYRHLVQRAKREGWDERRAAFRRRRDELRAAERSEEIARIASDLDVEAVRAARDGMAITRARLSELASVSARRYVALRDGDAPTARLNPPVDAMEVERLARSADTWYMLGTKAIGLGPRSTIELELHTDEPEGDERDAISLGIMAILQEHMPGMLPDDLDVIDVDSHLRLVAGDGPRSHLSGVDATDERVHPEDPDG